VKRTVRFLHKIKSGESDDFTVFDQQSIADSAAQAAQIIKLFGSIAASISLFVGGIGVMNIMLVSVHERVREIGIRLSLGATQQLIQIQFLFESVLLCGVGGILGIVLGLLLQLLLSSVTSLPGDVQLVPLLAAFFVTIGIGIFFGFYPARKASRLNPVDALADK
jgi:ABC-type antimicrobial peptide transport system permease subunit